MKILYMISRIGGLDGTALQYNNYVKMFKKRLGMEVYTITGKINEEFGPFRERENIALIPELSVEEDTRNYLFANSFRGKFDRKEWMPVFVKSKEHIKDQIVRKIKEISPEIIIMHNLFSFAHFHISAGVALREIVRLFPKKKFISIAPDSDFERKERLSQMDDEIVGMLSFNKKLPGPVYSPNVYHVVLNKSQMVQFTKEFSIPKSHVFKVPDFEDFENIEGIKLRSDFMELLENNHVSLKDGRIIAEKKACSKKDIYILFGVRPIERKSIIPCMYLTKALLSDIIGNRKMKFVITHPDREEGGTYFRKIIEFGMQQKLDIIYLGEKIKLRKDHDNDFKLDEIYYQLSKMDTLGFVGSSAGGWENVTVELSKFRIPVFVNPVLPSYKDMLSLGLDFKELPIAGLNIDPTTNLSAEKLLRDPKIRRFKKELLKILLDSKTRKKITDTNYDVSKSKLSLESVCRKWKIILKRIK